MHTIKLIKTKSNHILCHLELNKIKGLFLVDTGASNSCVGKDKIDFFNIKPKGGGEFVSAAGKEKIKVEKSMRSKLFHQNEKITSLVFYVFPLKPINKALAEEGVQEIDGILGGDFLFKVKGEINYKTKHLYIPA